MMSGIYLKIALPFLASHSSIWYASDRRRERFVEWAQNLDALVDCPAANVVHCPEGRGLVSGQSLFCAAINRRHQYEAGDPVEKAERAAKRYPRATRHAAHDGAVHPEVVHQQRDILGEPIPRERSRILRRILESRGQINGRRGRRGCLGCRNG